MTAEMLAKLDELIREEAARNGQVFVLQAIRNAVWRDAERRGEDLAEIYKTEQKQMAATAVFIQ